LEVNEVSTTSEVRDEGEGMRDEVKTESSFVPSIHSSLILHPFYRRWYWHGLSFSLRSSKSQRRHEDL